jgi:hypothetical protein
LRTLHGVVSLYPSPSCHNEDHNRSSGEPGLQVTPLGLGLFTQLSEFLIARAAGTEVIQPLLDLRES